MAEKQQHHFLIIAYPFQSHINPCINLAKHLISSTGADITLSTTVSAHRRMFSSISKPDQEVNDGLITYIPFSDGFDEGFKSGSMDPKEFVSHFRAKSQPNVSTLVGDLAAAGRPATCIIRTIFLEWVAEVAGEYGIPSVLYWIQAATMFTTYYHYFHGFENLIRSHADDPLFTVCFPGLKPLQIRDLPSFFTDTENTFHISLLDCFRGVFQVLERDGRVLVNTFKALEAEALDSVNNPQTLSLFAVGSCGPLSGGAGHLFKEDEKKYMEWLDTKEEGSVVYVSFGSFSLMKKEQKEEMVRGLKESKRPFLWVVRKDNREEGEGVIEIEEGGGEDGMVVEWCDQVRVLAHRAVGCFVAHCGWNSTLESLVCGVPMVGVPQWTDQYMNAKLVESLWGCGVRGEVDGDGVLQGEELVRCLELVMGEGEKGVEIRNKAKVWRDKALEAAADGGSSDVNLKAFVEHISE
ncbi:hypothetical protein J5N97_001616 [Dioscorea zingiberensis]|uniref:Glycosyltransferase n=1 Tax=Dioscorea zingiberensis TaxID=325984 RepID=A0A9D5H279_9LILI|nr:hypothetical protein J5N97_001616 [Dioscorea zingiberensis]